MMRGYKIFGPDWRCRDKQYTCPGRFVENVKPQVGSAGMHFCKTPVDCVSNVEFEPTYHVAEVVACGDVDTMGVVCCTNKLEVVREVSWTDLLKLVNTGKGCTGIRNSGNYNGGNYNSGDRNTGNYNSGHGNSDDYNAGNQNSGSCNSGDYNSGHWNSGNYNGGNYNSGQRNTGHRNSGNWNVGHWNSGCCNRGKYNSGDCNFRDWNCGNCNTGDHNVGHYNSGDYNSGNHNSGHWNCGNYNTGDWNTGDWNKTDGSSGCFNTVEQKIYLFNRQSEWTYSDWMVSDARRLLEKIDNNAPNWVTVGAMTDEEKAAHPEAATTGGYLRKRDNSECNVIWWRELTAAEKKIILLIPNFDKAIFKEITGIDVDKEA